MDSRKQERPPAPGRLDARFAHEARDWERLYEQGPSFPFGLWNRFGRVSVRQRLVRTFEWSGDLTGARVLDLGCGVGFALVQAVRRGAAEACGVDRSPEMLALAEKRVGAAGFVDRVTLRQGDARDLEFAGTRPFDFVWALGLFDYVTDPLEALRPAARLVGRRLMASFPDRAALRATPRRLYWRARGVAIELYDRSRIAALAEACGLQVVSLERLGPIFLLVAEPRPEGRNPLPRPARGW